MHAVLQLGQFFRCPVRDALVTDNAHELGAVPSRGLAVSQTGAEYRAATGVGLTAKAAQGQPNMDWEK